MWWEESVSSIGRYISKEIILFKKGYGLVRDYNLF